jgi:hypothetical protein
MTPRVVNLQSTSLPKLQIFWLAFIAIWPFAAFLKGLKIFRSPKVKTILWLFFIYFGFMFIIPEDVPGAPDSARYATKLMDAHKQPLSLNYLISSFYNPDGSNVDIYQPLATWFVAIFTDDPRFLFALFAAVFGFFYVQNLWMVFSRITSRVRWLLLFFMLAFALVNPIWNINGVRMWTAAQIFVFGILRMYLVNDRKGLIWAGFSILTHFSFLIPFLLLLMFQFIPVNLSLLFVFFIASSFVKEIELNVVRNLLSYLPEIFHSRMEGYLGDAYAERVAQKLETKAWHVGLASWAKEWVLYIWIIALYIFRHRWIKIQPQVTKLFMVAMFMGGFAQMASLLPSGGRFMVISHSLFFASIVLIMGAGLLKNKLPLLKLISYPLLGFSLIFSIRTGLDYIGIFTLIGNPFTAILHADQTPIIQFIKDLF